MRNNTMTNKTTNGIDTTSTTPLFGDDFEEQETGLAPLAAEDEGLDAVTSSFEEKSRWKPGKENLSYAGVGFATGNVVGGFIGHHVGKGNVAAVSESAAGKIAAKSYKVSGGRQVTLGDLGNLSGIQMGEAPALSKLGKTVLEPTAWRGPSQKSVLSDLAAYKKEIDRGKAAARLGYEAQLSHDKEAYGAMAHPLRRPLMALAAHAGWIDEAQLIGKMSVKALERLGVYLQNVLPRWGTPMGDILREALSKGIEIEQRMAACGLEGEALGEKYLEEVGALWADPKTAQKVDELEKSKAEGAQSLADLKKVMDELEKSKAEGAQSLADLKKVMGELEKSKAEGAQSLADLKKVKAKSKSRKVELAGAKAALDKTDAGEEMKKHAETKKVLKAAHREIADLKSALKETSSKLADSEAVSADASKLHYEVAAEVAGLKEETKAQAKAADDLDAEVNRLKSDLSAADIKAGEFRTGLAKELDELGYKLQDVYDAAQQKGANPPAKLRGSLSDARSLLSGLVSSIKKS